MPVTAAWCIRCGCKLFHCLRIVLIVFFDARPWLIFLCAVSASKLSLFLEFISMKKRFGFIAIGLFIIASSNVHAASSVDLRVTGSITPSACVPQLSSGGLIDYGKISVKDLRWDKVMPVQRLQLSVNCDAATFFAIKSTLSSNFSPIAMRTSPIIQIGRFGITSHSPFRSGA